MSAYCVDCNVKAAPERGPGTPLVIRHSEDCPNVTGKADSSPVETTAGSEQRPDHTGVIRPADEAEALTEALTRIERLWGVIGANGDTNSRLMRERDEARRDCERLERWLRAERVISDSRNATIERLWTQLNEATNVPDLGCGTGCDECEAKP